MKAIWNGAVIAESDSTMVIEGNHYFPRNSLNRTYFQDSSTTTTCSWKGVASYYDIVVGDKTNAGAAWYYRSPKPEAENIKDYVAFWKGVEVTG